MNTSETLFFYHSKLPLGACFAVFELAEERAEKYVAVFEKDVEKDMKKEK